MYLKKEFILLACILLFFGMTTLNVEAESFKPFFIYSEKGEMHNNFAPSGWMGDFKDLFYTEGWPKKPHSGATCIKVAYKEGSSQNHGWVGMYWQDPPGNWGDDPNGGFDLTGTKKLTFWARGEKGGEILNEVFVGGIKGQYPDSCRVAIGPIDLTKDWQKFEINLEGLNLSHIIGGFGWSTNLVTNPGGCIFYLDDVRFE